MSLMLCDVMVCMATEVIYNMFAAVHVIISELEVFCFVENKSIIILNGRWIEAIR